MSTPVTTPVFTAPQPGAEPTRRGLMGRKSVRSIATAAITLAISIGVGALVHSHDAAKAIDDFAAEVRDEPGIKSVREVPAPEGYEGKLDINNGAATVTFKHEGNDLVMSAEVRALGDPRVEAGIAKAADEAGFDDAR